jgi:hypothetical protein
LPCANPFRAELWTRERRWLPAADVRFHPWLLHLAVLPPRRPVHRSAGGTNPDNTRAYDTNMAAALPAQVIWRIMVNALVN